MIEFRFEGFEDLKKDLQRLNFAAQRTVMLKAVRAGAKVIQEKIEQLAPRDTGTLAESIIISAAGQRNDINSVSLLVGPSTEGFYGVFQEFGTAFIPAQPFLDPAFIDAENEAIQEMAKVLRAQIDRYSLI